MLDDGIKYGCASCCIPPIYVKQAKEYVGDKLPICTVIGFPHGSNTTATKVFETEDAVKNGADEIDMVINISWMKDKKYDDVLGEIKAIKAACHGKLLKVIVETSELDADERAKITKIVSESGAEYIKTSKMCIRDREWAFAHGCDRVALILTKPIGLVSSNARDEHLAHLLQSHYPAAAEGLRRRAWRYNTAVQRARELERQGLVCIIAPDSTEGMSTLTKNLSLIHI